MSDPNTRREIARRAASMMYAREEHEYFTAKRKAARQILGADRVQDLPSNREIRDEIQLLADMLEGESRGRELAAMRIEALRLMRALDQWKPRLIGSVLTGHVRKGSDIDLHVFTDSLGLLEDALAALGLEYSVEHKRVLKHNEQRVFTHIHVPGLGERGQYTAELTVYTADKSNYPFRSSITGKTMERAGIAELEALLRETAPDFEERMDRAAEHADVWELYRLLLLPLEKVKQSAKYHPEGDALYHALQVFQLARNVRGYDEEFLLAALLHDVGKAIDPHDHVGAGVEALEGSVTERTLWLVEHHMEAHEYRAGTLGHRARRRLAESEWLEDVLLLSEADQAGRQRGVIVPTIDEALEYIQGLNE
ncbi:MAG TPA: HD domain-containing protein [Phycisphaerales bacterium]|nr:HD domain-containing protein [Phycisphaerales bacterium]